MTGFSIVKNFNALNIASETTVWTPATGKRFIVKGFMLASSVAGNIVLKDNTGGTVLLVIPVAAGVPTPFVPFDKNGLPSAVANNLLTATGPGTLSGFIVGEELP